MDPITIALATFGIQKLRGQSTKRSFRDALIAGGIGQLGGMAGVGQNTMRKWAPTAFGQTGNILKGANIASQFASTPVGQMWGQPARDAVAQSGTKMGGDFIPAQAATKATGIRGWSKGAQLGAGLGIATLMEGDEDMPDPPFTEQDYKDAYAKQSKLTSGLGDAFSYTPSNVMYYGGPQSSDVYQYKH